MSNIYNINVFKTAYILMQIQIQMKISIKIQTVTKK